MSFRQLCRKKEEEPIKLKFRFKLIFLRIIRFDLVGIGNSLAIHFTTSLPASPVAKGCQEHSQPTLRLQASKTIWMMIMIIEFRLH